MFRLVLLLSVLWCGAAFADPPQGWPVSLQCVHRFIKTSAPAYVIVEPFPMVWSDADFGYEGCFSYASLEPSGVDGEYQLVGDDGTVVSLSALSSGVWTLGITTELIMVQSVDYGVGTMVGPTVYMFACGFAAGIPVVCLLWILWCLIRVFRMGVQGVSF